MKKILVFGGSGLVGSRFIKLNKDKFEIDAPNASKVDILNKNQLLGFVENLKPEIVINFAAFTNVQEAEKQKGQKGGFCYQVNVEGANNVARACQNFAVHLIHISTEYVFDGGKKDCPYTEEDQPHPINWYGQTKYLAEQLVSQSGANSTIMRISMPYVAHYEQKKDVARFFLEQFQNNLAIQAITDQKITPTFGDDIANALTFLIDVKPRGLYHVTVKDWTTPFGFASLIGKEFGYDTSLVKPISFEEYNRDKLAPLLQYSWLESAKFESRFGEGILHTVEESVKLFKQVVDPV